MTATLPLQSWRMFASCLLGNCNWFCRDCPTVNRDRPRFRAAIEADTASGAIVADVARRMHSVMAEFRREFETSGRARLYTQPASFALLDINCNFTARWARHIWHLMSISSLRSAPHVDTTWFSRSTRTALAGS